MTKFAQLLLVATCLAPIAFIHAAVELESRRYCYASGLGVAVVALVVTCHWLLRGVEKRSSRVPKAVKDPSPKDSEPLAFLVAYALPLVVAKKEGGSVFGLVAFAIAMGVALWQLQVFHVNPLLAVLGYHFFEAKADDGASVLVISRSKLLPAGDLSVVRISEYIWLQCAHDKREGEPATTSNTEGRSSI